MGRIEEKIEENKTKGKSLKIQCSECNRNTRHLIFQSIDTSVSELIDQQYSVDWANHYQIVQCQGYETISFGHFNWFSKYQDFDWDGSTERLYLNRLINED